MTNKEWLATLTTEEFYDVLHWLFTVHAFSVNNSKKGIIQWLDSTDSQWRRVYKGEEE
ncbi:MAG: hypothetical protein IKN65_06660 [Clostridia bacterium]|nr:hypothetical protein [Clostridia bacterium]